MNSSPHDPSLAAYKQSPATARWTAALEWFSLVALLFILAGWPAPETNEAHYWVKAKHYWNPAWCPNDFFLNSADAHEAFYFSVGWLTLFFSLEQAAWIGRVLGWMALAWGWQRLSFAMVPLRWAALFTFAGFWILLEYCQMAGEWVAGGCEAKVFAYALVFAGLADLVRSRYVWAAAWCGAGAAFHVLVGGWSLAALGFVWLVFDRGRETSILKFSGGLLLAVILSLPGLLPALLLQSNVDAATRREADWIYAYDRLPHHLIFHRFDPYRVSTFTGMLFAWIGLIAADLFASRNQNSLYSPAAWRMVAFSAASLLLALIGIAIDGLLGDQPRVAAQLLRYYWFRLADVAVPLAIVFMLASACAPAYREGKRWASLVVIAVILIEGFFIGQHLHIRANLPDTSSARQARVTDEAAWRDVCHWIGEHTPADAIFLTPRNQQTFHWYAGRGEVVAWKQLPQDARGIVEWRNRLALTRTRERPFSIAGLSGEEVRQLAERYGFEYAIIETNVPRPDWPHETVYANGAYEVWRLKRE